MICPQCNVENPPGGKFCNSCGSVLEKACSQCGAFARLDDRFCRACGQPLMAAADNAPSHQQISTKQYSRQDIEDLLSLRELIRKAEVASKTLSQDDVDKLFG